MLAVSHADTFIIIVLLGVLSSWFASRARLSFLLVCVFMLQSVLHESALRSSMAPPPSSELLPPIDLRDGVNLLPPGMRRSPRGSFSGVPSPGGTSSSSADRTLKFYSHSVGACLRLATECTVSSSLPVSSYHSWSYACSCP